MIGSIRPHKPSVSALERCRQEFLGCGVTRMPGASIAHTATSVTPISMPGAMPAMNSLLIEVLVATPKMMKDIDGGMIGAMTPPDAINPAERGTG